MITKPETSFEIDKNGEVLMSLTFLKENLKTKEIRRITLPKIILDSFLVEALESYATGGKNNTRLMVSQETPAVKFELGLEEDDSFMSEKIVYKEFTIEELEKELGYEVKIRD